MNTARLLVFFAATFVGPFTSAQSEVSLENLAQAASAVEAPDLSIEYTVRRRVRDPQLLRPEPPFTLKFGLGAGHHSNPGRLNHPDGGAFGNTRFEAATKFSLARNSLTASGFVDATEYDRGDPNFNLLDTQFNVGLKRAFSGDVLLNSAVRLDLLRVNNRDLSRYARWTNDLSTGVREGINAGVRIMMEKRDDRISASNAPGNRDAFRASFGPTVAWDLPGDRGGTVTFAYSRGSVASRGPDEDLWQHNTSVKLVKWTITSSLLLENLEAVLEKRKGDHIHTRLLTGRRWDDDFSVSSSIQWRPDPALRIVIGRKIIPCEIRFTLGYGNVNTNLVALKYHQFNGAVKATFAL